MRRQVRVIGGEVRSYGRRGEWASFLLGRGSEHEVPLTLRITQTPSDDRVTLRLEGRLRAVEVPELERAVAAGVQTVDLEHLLSADEEGVAALRRLRDRGVEIRNASHYLAILLA